MDGSPCKDGLTYERDTRKKPDIDLKRAFKKGWNRGVASHHCGDPENVKLGSHVECNSDEGCLPETLAGRLTWWNLGYRLGRLFKETSVGLVEEMYQWSAKQYLENKGKRQG